MCDDDENSAAGFEKLVFQQELNEVYLLLDFISGQPSRDMSSLDGKIVDPANSAQKLTATQIVERVSGLRYPPAKSPPNAPPAQGNVQAPPADGEENGKPVAATNAHKNDYLSTKGRDAAFLLTLKDVLNSVARPARGLTVAYTILFSESGKGNKTSRLRAAELAFPGLVANARRFRLIKGVLTWSGLAITLVAALLLWQVTYGAQLAAHFDKARLDDAQSAAALYTEIDRNKQPDIKLLDLTKLCRIPSAADADPVSTDPEDDTRDSKLRQLCDEYAYRHALFCVAINDIGRFSQSKLFVAARRLLPVHALKPSSPCASTDPGIDKGRQEDAQSIAGVLSMMSNYFLTILFGLAGTLTALVRGIQDKVTESTLLPRDQALALIRLPLGMVAGICVGLFLTPSALTTQTAGNIGAFTLSASGIAFLAGYGAEAFFRALDTLITRVFYFDKDSSTAKA